MFRYMGTMARYPARALFLSYLTAILVGGFLLWLPLSRQPHVERHVTFVDGVFTATSAVCVTGLSVRLTGTEFSFFGQVVILVLIQLGGIGITTMASFVGLALTGRENLHDKAMIVETLGSRARENLGSVFSRVIGSVL